MERSAMRGKESFASQSRFERILQLLAYLQGGPRFNTDELARALGVSRRTVFRYIGLLQGLGIPVYFDEASDSYRLEPASMPLINAITASEIEMLVWAAHLSILRSIPEFSSAIDRTVVKLMGTLPESKRTQSAKLLKASAPRARSVRPVVQRVDVLEAILTGIREGLQVRIAVSASACGSRWQTNLAPYRIAASLRRWVLIGRSSVHREIGAFNMSTIERAEVTGDSFLVPRGFRLRGDVAAFHVIDRPPQQPSAKNRPKSAGRHGKFRRLRGQTGP